ncbi:MAG: D-ribose pyranase [Stappiaceae bacterium]
MKRTPLLNRHLSALVASLGHLDEIVIGDAGLPVPDGVPVIDLAVKRGVPTLWDVLDALRSELQIEGACHASEVSKELQLQMTGFLGVWGQETDQKIAIEVCSHEEFKQRSRQAKAVIRTGECVPYANLILVCGVAF